MIKTIQSSVLYIYSFTWMVDLREELLLNSVISFRMPQTDKTSESNMYYIVRLSVCGRCVARSS